MATTPGRIGNLGPFDSMDHLIQNSFSFKNHSTFLYHCNNSISSISSRHTISSRYDNNPDQSTHVRPSVLHETIHQEARSAPLISWALFIGKTHGLHLPLSPLSNLSWLPGDICLLLLSLSFATGSWSCFCFCWSHRWVVGWVVLLFTVLLSCWPVFMVLVNCSRKGAPSATDSRMVWISPTRASISGAWAFLPICFPEVESSDILQDDSVNKHPPSLFPWWIFPKSLSICSQGARILQIKLGKTNWLSSFHGKPVKFTLACKCLQPRFWTMYCFNLQANGFPVICSCLLHVEIVSHGLIGAYGGFSYRQPIVHNTVK